jgi:hypothetical protein
MLGVLNVDLVVLMFTLHTQYGYSLSFPNIFGIVVTKKWWPKRSLSLNMELGLFTFWVLGFFEKFIGWSAQKKEATFLGFFKYFSEKPTKTPQKRLFL